MTTQVEIELLAYINSIPQVKQDTEEWHMARSDTVGGSEMQYIITGNYNAFIKMKTGKAPFYGNIHTKWGKLIEQVSRMFMENVTGNLIYEVGSIAGIIHRQRYSPDGLGISNNKIILYEFKNPTVSLPDGRIPKKYLPQVKTGLCSIPIVDHAIFVNSAYRRCSFKNANFTSDHIYDIHKENIITNAAIATGVILFEITDESWQLLHEDEHFFNDNSDLFEYQDYGRGNRFSLERLLGYCEEKTVKPIYCPMIINKEELIDVYPEYSGITALPDVEHERVNKMIKRQIEDYEGAPERLAGFMCYKLLLVDIIEEKRDESYAELIKKHVSAATQALDAAKREEEIKDNE